MIRAWCVKSKNGEPQSIWLTLKPVNSVRDDETVVPVEIYEAGETKAQRDEMRGWFFDTQTVAALHQTIAALERECEKHKNAVAVYNEDCIAAEAALQKLAASEPVAWCQQAISDGSYGAPVVFTGHWMYEQNLAKAKQEPWIVNGVAKLAPLYAAPPRTYDDGLEAAAKVCKGLKI